MPLAALPGATRRREARGQGGGLRPSSCPHSLRLGRSEGIKRLSRHKRCPPTGYPLYSTVRLTPSPLVGGPWRRFLDVALPAPLLTLSNARHKIEAQAERVSEQAAVLAAKLEACADRVSRAEARAEQGSSQKTENKAR